MTKTFTTNDGLFTFTAKVEFFNKTGEDFLNKNTYQLISESKIVPYLHNEVGPALVDHKEGNTLYFLNGKEVTGEALEEFKHNLKFNEKLEDLISK